MVLVQWYLLSAQRWYKHNNPDSQLVCGLYRLFQEQTSTCVTEVDKRAIQDVINFFNWVIFSMTSGMFTRVAEQSDLKS